MFDGFGSAIISGIILAFMVGPVFFALIETSITKGFKAGLFFDMGAIFADIVFILIAYFSTNKLLEKVQDTPALLIFGGGILVAYGIISYIKTSKSFFKIAREHYAVKVKKNLGGLFLKGFLLNFVNFGVLAGWIGILIIGKARTNPDCDNCIIYFLVTVLLSFFTVDILKILLSKSLKSKMTPRFVFKTKKWVSILILIFGVILLLQGVYPDKVKNELDKIPKSNDVLERPIPPVKEGTEVFQ